MQAAWRFVGSFDPPYFVGRMWSIVVAGFWQPGVIWQVWLSFWRIVVRRCCGTRCFLVWQQRVVGLRSLPQVAHMVAWGMVRRRVGRVMRCRRLVG